MATAMEEMTSSA